MDLEVEGLYYPSSENKDADQFRGYRETDLRLCFRICKNPVFSRRGSYIRRRVPEEGLEGERTRQDQRGFCQVQ